MSNGYVRSTRKVVGEAVEVGVNVSDGEVILHRSGNSIHEVGTRSRGYEAD